MKHPNKEDLMRKWEPILGSMGMTSSQLDNLSQLAENQSNQILEETKTEEFPTLLPMAMKISAQTIGMDLVSVQPMTGPGGMSNEERERIEAEIKQKNRDGKIDSLIEGVEYKEEKVEDHPDYKPGSGGQLFYMDYTYGSTHSEDYHHGRVGAHKKTRRSKKKKKNGGI